VNEKQIWVRAFYGFDPEGAGFIGFTEEWQRTEMLTKMRDGDLILIYGAVDSLTQPNLQRQALGFLEITLETCTDLERMSAEAIQWKVDHKFENRWRFGIKVRRAWRITNRVHIKTIAPNSYHSDYRFERTTKAKLLEPEEQRRALSHHVRQVNVFGEEPVNIGDLTSGTLEQVLSPSRGIPPMFGKRTVEVEDGENHVYLMAFAGGAEFLLGRTGSHVGHALVKVGRSNDPNRRLSEMNSGFPEKAISKWQLKNTQKFPDGATAHEIEAQLKHDFDKAFRSQGGEFFTGDFKAMEARFHSVCVAGMPRILGAPGKAQGVK
jgi:hypothetical protein